MAAYVYNCKRCKLGRRVEYPGAPVGFQRLPHRLDEQGRQVTPGAYIMSSGGGRPTVYGGDPLGLCPGCGRVMTSGQIQASTRPEVRCDARCIGARGFQCDCSCGGANHGAGWSQLGAPLSSILGVPA
jgi:hypothetical protein